MLFNKTRGKCSRGICRPWRQIYFEGDDVLSAFGSGQEGFIIGEWRAKKRREVRGWLCLYQANISALTFISSILHSYLHVKYFSKIVMTAWADPHMVKGSVCAFRFFVCLYVYDCFTSYALTLQGGGWRRVLFCEQRARSWCVCRLSGVWLPI